MGDVTSLRKQFTGEGRNRYIIRSTYEVGRYLSAKTIDLRGILRHAATKWWNLIRGDWETIITCPRGVSWNWRVGLALPRATPSSRALRCVSGNIYNTVSRKLTSNYRYLFEFVQITNQCDEPFKPREALNSRHKLVRIPGEKCQNIPFFKFENWADRAPAAV